MMFVAELNVIRDDGLQLLHEPEDDDAAADEQQAEGGEEQPAVVHAGGVIHSLVIVSWLLRFKELRGAEIALTKAPRAGTADPRVI